MADIETAQQRHLSLQKPNTLLVYFFGDRSFGWFGTDTLEPFEENFAKYSKQRAKNQVLNVEELLVAALLRPDCLLDTVSCQHSTVTATGAIPGHAFVS